MSIFKINWYPEENRRVDPRPELVNADDYEYVRNETTGTFIGLRFFNTEGTIMWLFEIPISIEKLVVA